MSTHYWTPIGTTIVASDNSVKAFRGKYDGCGYSIKGLNFEKTTSAYAINNGYCGLFGDISSSGVAKNIRLVDVNVQDVNTVRLGLITGWLAGGTVKNCYVSSRYVSQESNCRDFYMGGIAGINQGNISGCIVDIQNMASSIHPDYYNYDHSNYIGGITGYDVGGGTIENCFVKGNLSILSSNKSLGGIGGIIGYSYGGTVKSCYFEGKVSASSININASYYGGAVIGYIYGSDTSIKNVLIFADINCDRFTSSAGQANGWGLTGNSGYSATIENYVSEICDRRSNPLFIKRCQSGCEYTDWIKTFNGRLLPSGLSWLATGGIKLTGIEEVEEMGYTAV